ncbi:MAG: retropepsin-like aspartic protease [Rhodanobacter sp.]
MLLAMVAGAWGMLAVPCSAGTATGKLSSDAVEAKAMLTVEQALARADVPVLARMYQTSTDPVTRVLAAMALERIHFNLGKSSEDARICERSLIDSKPDIAFFCARFANGNLRLSRGAKLADADELDIARRFAGKVPDTELDRLRSHVAAHAAIPGMQVIEPSVPFSIPVERSLANGKLPTVEVESHGRKARLIVDTGSSTLTLDQDTARELGVRMLNRPGKTSGLLSRDIPVSYGMLDELGIGAVTMRNVPVAVIPAPRRLIGIDILRQLGAFRLGEKAIAVGNIDATCKEPMLVASDVWGNHLRMIAALPIDGQTRATLIDSGTSAWLSGDQNTLGQLHTHSAARMAIHDMGPRRHAARVSQATVDVDISGQPFTIGFEIFKDASLPWHYILGSGALPYMDFYFDFDNRHACLLLHDHPH